jgi:peroxiredoxin
MQNILRKSLLSLLILFIFLSINAQIVTIKGTAKSYAGDELVFSAYSDQITHTEKVISKSVVDSTGKFNFTFNIDETIPVFIHLGVFKGYLLIEPNSIYEIVLPLKVQKKIEDQLNPYFNETEYNISILNNKENELNSLIRKFDKLLAKHLFNAMRQQYARYSKAKIDSITNDIDKNLPKSDNAYFNNYKEYKYASLRHLAYIRNKEHLIRDYFTSKPVLYENAAYMDMFNQVFSQYLTLYPHTAGDSSVKYIIFVKKSLSELNKVLGKNQNLFNDTLKELVILKGLYDFYFIDTNPKPEILQILDSIILTSKIPRHIKIASDFKETASLLLLGSPAPTFQLPDKENKRISLSKLNGKFIYLGFINTKSYTCQQEFELINNLYKKKYDQLEIYLVFVEDNMMTMSNFLEKNKYTWNALYYEKQDDLLKNYKIKAYPTYYLIDPDGKLAMYPAPSPTENFEQRYFPVLQSWKTQQIRNQAKNKGLNR